jgi:hypothetical protein
LPKLRDILPAIQKCIIKVLAFMPCRYQLLVKLQFIFSSLSLVL